MNPQPQEWKGERGEINKNIKWGFWDSIPQPHYQKNKEVVDVLTQNLPVTSENKEWIKRGFQGFIPQPLSLAELGNTIFNEK